MTRSPKPPSQADAKAAVRNVIEWVGDDPGARQEVFDLLRG